MNSLTQDLRYALRQLRKSPVFALTAVITLGLGIGVNAAMFSVIEQVLLRPLPYHSASQLVMIAPHPVTGGGFDPASLPDVRDWKTRAHVFSDLAWWTIQVPTLGGRDNPELVAQISSSANLLEVLGVQPAIGRGFVPEDAKQNRAQVVILGDSTWHKVFHADRSVIGRVVPINGDPYTVIGVMPPNFEFPQTTGDEIYSPLPNDSSFEDRGNSSISAVARLRPGISVQQAQQEINGIHAQLLHEYANESTEPVRVESLRDVATDNVRSGLYALDAAVAVVWLIACANLAGLMLARANARRRELAIRGALGAAKSRLVRQFLTESLLVSLVGGAAGLVAAWVSLRILSHYLSNAVPFGEHIHIDAGVCAILILLSCLSAVFFGVGPGLYGANLPVQEGLRDGAAASGTSKKHARWRDALVVGEIGLTLTLLIAAGLLIQTLWQLRHTNLGFAPEQVDATSIFMPTHGAWWTGGDKTAPSIVTGFYDPLQEKLRHTPGIQSVGMATIRPFTSNHFTLDIWPADRPQPSKADAMGAAVRASNADFFRTMGIAITSGRGFEETDHAGAPLAVVVNQEFVRRILKGRDPLGVRLKWDDEDKALTATIVGTIADLHQESVRAGSAPEIYFNLEQLVPGQDIYSILAGFHMDIVVRTNLASEVAFRAVRDAVHELNPNLAFAEQTTMQQVIDNSLGAQTLAARLLAIFGFVALLIAIAGIYGLLAYSVSQRTRELGLRIALGAQRENILWLVLRHAILLLATGMAIGLGVAWAASSVLRSFLYGAAAYDAATVVLVVLILGLCSMAASYLPARRAAAVDPIEALRTE
ncbi:MAG TPA: ABC transporter permease [Acidobacteriaceae bacterium]|nr:ABC transporter permease [Acidobacteriaceae bacterium]